MCSSLFFSLIHLQQFVNTTAILSYMLSIAAHNPQFSCIRFCIYIQSPASVLLRSPTCRIQHPILGSRTIKVIARTARRIYQLHIKSIPNADCPLHRDNPGIGVSRLLFPFTTVNNKACISRLICRHHGSEDNPFSGIGGKNRGCRVTMYHTTEYL